MQDARNTVEFLRTVFRYLGTGYNAVQAAKIPEHKLKNREKILERIADRYETNRSRGSRQHRRIKGLANYAAVAFNDIVLVFRTPGTHSDKPAAFISIEKPFHVRLSPFLSFTFHRQENGRWTVRLGKVDYLRFKEDFRLAILHNKYKDYMRVRRMWLNLPRYRGIGKQGQSLHRQIKKWLKQQNLKHWPTLY
ncbi:MAG: hypothetical protein GXO39_05990 [Thermotogae bacterium]|nr:hypothetical protein [Thermotogota bacterium]